MSEVTYESVLRVRQQLYNSRLNDGSLTPFIWPWDTLPVLYLFIAVFVSPLLSRPVARLWNIATLLAVVGHSTYVIFHRRCLAMASGYLGPLMLTLGAIMTLVFLFCRDPCRDFARLEWRAIEAEKIKDTSLKSENGHLEQAQQLRRRKQTSQSGTDPIMDAAPQSSHRLVWQTMPSGYVHRIDWVMDLISSLRGPNWNYRIPTLPKLSAPPAPSDSIHLSSSLETTDAVVFEAAYDSPAAQNFRFHAVVRTTVLYLLIDVIKVVMISDPYFLGVADLDSPSPWRLIPIIHAYSGLPVLFPIRTLRLLISLAGVLNALTLIFSLSSTVLYSTIPQIVNPRTFTYSPFLDLRFFATLSAPPFPAIADTGLAGFWGRYWHQMFRFAITEPSKAAIKYLNLSKRSTLTRTIQLFIAFGLTGILHMTASYGCFSIVPSRPLMPLLFFLSQGTGILIQTFISDLVPPPIKQRIPPMARKVTNSLFTLVWLYITGPLLADDFARCGIWLFEPVPISLIRGIRGEGWWTWYGIRVQWWHGLEGQTTPFWDKGIGLF